MGNRKERQKIYFILIRPDGDVTKADLSDNQVESFDESGTGQNDSQVELMQVTWSYGNKKHM